MCTQSMLEWNEFYEQRDEWIRQERRKLCLTIDGAVSAANTIYRRERDGDDLSHHWEVVARNIIDDAARHTDLIISNECDAIVYLICWYHKRTGFFSRDWIPLIDFLER